MAYSESVHWCPRPESITRVTLGSAGFMCNFWGVKLNETVQYEIPLAVLNIGTEEGMDGSDEVYPKPGDWLKANVMRFYFTNEQIIEAARDDLFPDAINYTPYTGVYFMVKDGEIVYVGQSRNIQYRVSEHFWMRADGVAWFEAPRRFLDYLETFYIRRILPRNNVKIPFYDKYDPLLPEELRVPKDRTQPYFKR
jgi:hypothetical protein